MEANDKAIELKELWSRYKLESDEVARERLVLAYSSWSSTSPVAWRRACRRTSRRPT